jgi:small subunit ribosomal protein S20
MPLIKSAIKKMRQDKARTLVNQEKRSTLRKALKEVRTKHTPETLQTAYSALDKAAKKGLIHKNKAARSKAMLAKLVKSTVVSKPATAAATKKTTRTRKVAAKSK